MHRKVTTQESTGDNIGEQTIGEKKKRLAGSSDHSIWTSMHANMVGILLIAEVKIVTVSIVKDGGRYFEGGGRVVLYVSVKK